MKITKITTYLIESKLKKPFWWSNGKATKRTAALVKISTDEGIEGWGEGYELWKPDLRGLDMGLVGDKLDRAIREAFTKSVGC